MTDSPVAILRDQATEACLLDLDRNDLLSSQVFPLLSLSDWQQCDADYLLACENGRLQLQARERKLQPLLVDFTEGTMGYRGQQNVRNEMVVKAVLGRDKQHLPSVIDATAGLGRDSFLLAVLGCRVTMIERHPIVSALLQDGLQRYRQGGELAVIERLDFVYGDFSRGDGPATAKVVYLDPMFPKREKSALVKKEMQIFKQMVGGDADSDRLLPEAKNRATRKVVVKRPAKAEHLSDATPTYSLSGRSSRFDIYQVGPAAV